MAKTGVIHYNFPGFTWEGFLDFCVETGYRFVELQIGDVWPPGEGEPARRAERVRRDLDARGLKASALSAGNDFVLLDGEAIGRQVERMRSVCCELAPIIGTDTIRTEGGRPKDAVPPERYAEAISECLKRCAPFVEEAGVRLALDNHGPVTNDAELQVDIFERVGSRNVGANLDTMNYRWFGHDLATIGRFYETIAPYVFHTHLKDGTGSRGDYRGAALGEGEIDLARAIACLRQVGYDGVWCVEYEGPEAEGGVGYAKCYKWAMEHL